MIPESFWIKLVDYEGAGMTTKLEELRAAFEASTPGEWGPLVTCEELHVCTPVNEGCDVGTVCIPYERSDATFIAIAHNLMPTLLEAVNHLAECQELLRDYPWMYQECKRILEKLK